MNKINIKKDDLVVVLSGKDKGKQGKVLEVMPKEGKVIVEKVNVVSRHTKPRKQGEQGGILKKDLFQLRLQHATNQLENPVKIAEVKKDIARVKTILRELQLAGR